MLEPAASVAEYNPLSFIVDGIREPIIGGFVGDDELKAVAAVLGDRALRLLRSARCALRGRRAEGRVSRARRASGHGPGAGAPGAERDHARARRGDPRRAGADDLLPRPDQRLRQPHPAARVRHRQLPELPDPGQPAAGRRFTGAATGVNLARDIEQGWFDRLLASPAPRPVLLGRAGAVGEPAGAAARDLPADRRLRRSASHWPGLLGLADRARPDRDGDGGRRRDLGHLARASVQDPVRGAADAGGMLLAVLHDDRLRAARPAHRLAPGRSPGSTR